MASISFTVFSDDFLCVYAHSVLYSALYFSMRVRTLSALLHIACIQDSRETQTPTPQSHTD